MTETSYCPEHPDTPTNLRCSRCEKLICPRCLVHSPVGVRCRECGKGIRLPIYDVSASQVLRAILASLVIGVMGGLALALIVRPLLLGSGFLYIASLAGFGYLVAEGVGRAANQKRGRILQLVTMAGVLAALMVVVVAPVGFVGSNMDLFDLVGGGLAFYIAFIRLR